MLKKILFTFTAILLFALSDPLTLLRASASELNFAVETVIPENQINKKLTYFNLLIEPSEKQILEIKLRNDTDKDVTVVPKIASATTNHNGVVEYGSSDVEADSTLQYNMKDIVTTEEEVTIPAKGSYTLKLEVNMPDEEFDGVLAGGITLQEKDDESSDNGDEVSGDKSGLSIENKFAYVVAIVLQNNENKVSPELTLNDIYPDQINKRNVIKANVQNIMPMYMNQMSVNAKITEKGKSEVLYEATSESLQMAPNSNMDYPIRLNGEALKGGEYTLDMTVTSMGETWHWTKDYKIKPEIAKDLNEEDVTIQNDYTWLYIAGGIAVILLAILLWLLFWRRKNRKEKEQEQTERNDLELM
ncbi:DUF916 and DUF3324 domain-containing protein [Bacillus sp. HSf4]|uniref:DUF916 and DUF3324 domain-containing protein n=1 Tax=Bacillus sp. HSf4 TaxID=3035514 RepID=UPI00240A00FA|nr:DUF916 and DUF3324 domain-containing protein [Bacillus sp. HSf4]WFA03819.1 DUF916 and DUF3324 domain-containing protein [Bacillus sp. HSf4]